jgi:integrase
VVSLGFDADGKRVRRKVSGKTRAEVKDKLKALHSELDAGLRTAQGYTVDKAVADWLEEGLPGRTVKTVEANRDSLRPLPEIAVGTLRGQRERQAAERALAGELWQEFGLVFTTSAGTGYEPHNLRRDFRRVTAAAGLGARWVPKELRTSFVSMMSYQGVPVEEIARLAGHASSRTTEVIYRRELRPVITTGAEVMDQIFRPKQPRGSTATATG